MKKYTTKLLHLTIYTIFFIVPLSFWLSCHESFETPKSINFYVLLSLAVALFMLQQALNKNFTFKYTSFSVPVLALLLVFFASLLKSVIINKYAFPIHWQFFKLIMANVVLYFLIINTFAKNDILKLIFFVLLSHFIVVSYGVLQYFGIDIIHWASFGEGRVYSTMGNPDYMATQFGDVIPLLIVLSLTNIRRITRFIILLFLVLMFFLIIVSHGRGAWFGFLGSLVYLFAMFAFAYGREFFAKYRYFFGFITAFVIFLVFIFSVPNPLNRNSNTIIDRLKSGMTMTSDSVAVRLLYYESALQMAKYNPLFGVGVGGFSLNTAFYQRKVYDRWLKVYPPLADKIQPHVELYTHNDFLQTLSEIGLAGFGIFTWLFTCFFIMAGKKLTKEENQLTKNILLGLTASVIAFLLNGLLNFPWRVVPTLILLWTVFSFFSLAENKKIIKYNFNAGLEWLVPLLMIIVLFISTLQVKTLYADIGVKDGQTFFAAGKYEDARKTFENALSSNPRGTDMIELVLYTGNAYNALKDINKALDYYKKGLAMFPNFIESHYNIANVYMNNGMIDDAIKEYDAVLSLDPKFTAAINNLANIYYSKKDFEKCRDLYIDSVKYNPTGVESMYNLGATYLMLKQYDKAAEEFRKVLEIKPDYSLAKEWLQKMKMMGLIK